MSALGYYIHLTTTGYLKNGTYEEGKGKNVYPFYNEFLKERTAHLEDKGISQDTIDELKLRLANDSITQEKRDALKLTQEYQKMLDEVYQNISKFAEKSALKEYFKLDKDNKFLPSSNSVLRPLSANQIKKKKEKKEELNKTIEKLNGQEMVSNKQVKDLLNQYKALGSVVSPIQASPDIKSVMGQMQESLAALSFDNIYTAVGGRFGEELIYAIRDVKNKEVVKGLKQAIVGGDKTEITINENMLAAPIDKVFSSAKTTDETGTTYIIGNTQDKIDVQIVVNNEDLFASVKSYKNLHKVGATIEQKKSLIYPLIFLNQFYENFGNHWLNMHAGRLLKSSAKNNADLILKQEFAYEALVTGNPLKNNAAPAEVFIAIDRHSGKVFINNTYNILNKQFNSFSFSRNLSNIKFQNRRADTAEHRIINLLQQVRQTQITVHLNLKKYL